MGSRTAHGYVVINFKDCTLTFNAGFKSKTLVDHVGLNRKLTFGTKTRIWDIHNLDPLAKLKKTSSYIGLVDQPEDRERFSGPYLILSR